MLRTYFSWDRFHAFFPLAKARPTAAWPAPSAIRPFATCSELPDSPLTEPQLDAAEPVMNEALRLGIRIAGHYKRKFSRPRPYETDPTLTPCAHKPGGRTSYPSSHALAAGQDLAGQICGRLLARDDFRQALGLPPVNQ